jgi:hypothetical protein
MGCIESAVCASDMFINLAGFIFSAAAAYHHLGWGFDADYP